MQSKIIWPLRLIWIGFFILPFLGYSYLFFLASLLTALFNLFLYPVLQSKRIYHLQHTTRDFNQNLMEEMARRKNSQPD
jgi:hypothetical protein